MKRLIALFALAGLLLFTAPSAYAAELPGIGDKDIDTFMAEYMQEAGLDEDNFAMGWYNTVTGESWYFGADEYRVAGSVYKLPLAMVILDMVADGTLAADEIVGGYDIDTALKMTILYSSDEVAQSLRRRVSADNVTYRSELAAYSGIELSDLPEEYYSLNHISPRFMIETLRTLHENETRYARLIELLKEAGENRLFRLYQGEWDIAHKYGIYEGAINDCGIIYTPEPFLLAAFFQDVPESERKLGELAAIMTEYSIRQEGAAPAVAEATPEPTAPPEPTPAQTAEPVQTPEPPAQAPRSSEKTALLVLFALLAVMCLAGALWRIRRRDTRLAVTFLLLLAAAAAIAFIALLRFRAQEASMYESAEVGIVASDIYTV